MSTILDTIAAHARQRVAADRAENSLDALKELCQEGGIANGKPSTTLSREKG